MADKKKLEQFTFPKGEALFARLEQPYHFSKRDKRTVPCKPSDAGAEYSISIKLPTREATPIIEKIKDAWKDYNATEQPGTWPFRNEVNKDTKEPTGNVLFKTKFNASYQNKDGSFASVAIFDAKGHKLPKNFEIGNGSIIRLGVQLVPHDMQGGGISLRLKGVQVIEPRGGSNFGAMFEEEEGFEADEADTSNDETTEDSNVQF
jgi:hypothetical protein